jgi:alginate O-acetyltransferase complex protein AlgI
MIFLSYWFLVAFLVCFLPVYWLPWKPGVRKLLLLAASIVFHGHFAGPAGVLPIVALGILTYIAGLTRSKAMCIVGIVASVAALLFYKYLHFLCENLLGALAPSWGAAAWSTAQGWVPGAPPLAISFFAFEFVHYLIEIHRGHEPIRSPIDFSLFAIFWPSIVAGPVKRYSQFLPELAKGSQHVTSDDVMIGFLRLAMGIVKKLIIADNLTAWIGFWDKQYASLSIYSRWLLCIAIAFRILLDFSGYSDMAIGFARMMGMRLPENFWFPYIARSPADFWRRWHISLSTWIRDYIYIPLGGNRMGPVRKVFNGLLAFTLCGLWHGAAWNFIIWGLYHGAGLAVTATVPKLLGRTGARLEAALTRFWPAAWLLTMLFVGVGWLFFFYPVPQAWAMLRLLVVRQ